MAVRPDLLRVLTLLTSSITAAFIHSPIRDGKKDGASSVLPEIKTQSHAILVGSLNSS
jgi:hypothetical protein